MHLVKNYLNVFLRNILNIQDIKDKIIQNDRQGE